ncbi:MAG: DUF4290 domain-containing protein, partial [Muribaculaceae bacterium]|nr:DUF4290 domain-containing protein [Muribaculaceae bacterium]
GRNIQQMVDYCCTIEDREERNKCAYSIINTMSNMFVHLSHEADFKHKLWDHLAIMSDFKLDVDSPYDMVKPENLSTKPQPIEYKLENIKMRHYGKIVDRMIQRACEWPDGEEKEALVMLIANHMKKLIYQINNEDVEDAKIFKDLEFFSKGQIKLDPETHSLHEFKIAPSSGQQASKKEEEKITTPPKHDNSQ